MSLTACSDAELVARCRAGDDEAWRALVDRFSRYVYAIAVQGFGLSEHDADDVFQDVFSRVYERLGQLRDDDAVRPWIAQLTRRVCIDGLRAGGRTEPVDEERLGAEVDEALVRIDESYGIYRLLAELPERCREILDRFFTRDESYRTIGEALELPPGTIASRISRCLQKLRTLLEPEGRSGAVAPSGARVTR